MSMVEIKKALDDKLLLLPWITDKAKQVAWEDLIFEPETGKPYLSTAELRNTPVDLDLAAQDVELRGIYQVDVHYQAGKGAAAALAIADQLAAHFKPVQLLQAGSRTVTISKSPAIASGYPDENGWYIIPVSIMWQSYP